MPSGVAYKSFEAGSGVRWDWEGQQTCEVVDNDLYASRFEHFRLFRADFYSGLVPSPLPEGDGDLVYFDYSSLGLVIVGFASWHGNDCFCHVGDIAPSSLSLSRTLLASSEASTARPSPAAGRR